MERIIVENFAGIEKVDVEIKRINVFLGQQGTGKSVVAKLLYYFKRFYTELLSDILSGKTRAEFNKNQLDWFMKYFPKESWPGGDFRIQYESNGTTITIHCTAKKLKLDYSDDLKDVFAKCQQIYKEFNKAKETNSAVSFLFDGRDMSKKILEYYVNEMGKLSTYLQFFIPAGRSFYATFQDNSFRFMNEGFSFDPFFMNFGEFYQSWKNEHSHIYEFLLKKEPVIRQILDGQYKRENDKDYIIHPDGRKVNVINASSGQQEVLPLVLAVNAMQNLSFAETGGTTLYIEEPEAHLFPESQKRVVELLTRTYNELKPDFQLIITTHSPYVLTSFNNLLLAGRLAAESPAMGKEISKIVPRKEQVAPEDFAAYSFGAGKAADIIDSDTQLISGTVLDGVSEEIEKQFDRLLEAELAHA